MKAFKIIVSVVLSVLLLGAGIAAQSVALAKYTLLDPAFYGETGQDAYLLIGRMVVRRMADAVLDRAPAIVLRTTDREQAWALAARALPPENVAAMLENSAPHIVYFLLYGGDIPELAGSAEFARGEVAVVKSLLTDGAWDMLPEKPAFPAFMPFTPEWNLGYGKNLAQSLWSWRYYVGMADYVLWLALAAVVLMAGLLYLLWLKKRRPFFTSTGILFTLNGILLLAFAIAAAYFCQPMAVRAAALYPMSSAAELFANDWPALLSAVLLPFRDIFFISSTVSLSLGITMFASGITRDNPLWQWPQKRHAATTEKTRHKEVKSRKPRHERKG